jgi:hypothetical protein
VVLFVRASIALEIPNDFDLERMIPLSENAAIVTKADKQGKKPLRPKEIREVVTAKERY